MTMKTPAGGAAVRVIVLANHSAQFTDADLQTTVTALRVQVKVACEAWGLQVPVVDTVRPDVPIPPTGVALIGVFDNSTQAAGILGYHTTTAVGEPDGFIYCDPVFSNGGQALTGELSVSATISHETLELIWDASCNLYASDASGNLWCREACDQVEADARSINVAGGTVSLSNFLYPAAFDPGSAGPYDWMGLCTAPFEIRPGAYAVVNGQQQFGARPSSITQAGAVAVRRAGKTESTSRTSRRLAAFPAIQGAVRAL